MDQAPFDKATEDVVRVSMERIKKALAITLKDTKSEDKIYMTWTTYFGARVIVKSDGSKETLNEIKQRVVSLL